MKHNRKHQMFGWLSASALLLTTACTSVADLDVAQVDNHDQNVVTLTVRPQSLASGMRDASEGEGDIDLETQNKHIGNGENIDVLIYTVYELSEDGTLIPTENPDLIKVNEELEKKGFTPGLGQSVVPVSWNGDNSCKVRLVLEPGKKYKVAFWAQSEKAKDVFDATDLRKVHVKYDNAKNNDELRDAFCAVSDTIVSTVVENRVTLRRPFAQINVGTTGADYKNIVIGKQVYSNRKVTQSKIQLYGVAQYYDVVKSKSLTADELATGEEATTNAVFDYDIIPAFMYVDPVPTEDADLYGMSTNEEFLKVDLDKDGYFAAYKINYPTLSRKGRYLTETFKYLSMCYALVPTAGGGATLSKVEVSFAETADDGTDKNGYTPITLTNVPVQRNYRTNILGGLKWMKDPNPKDPKNPDNPDPDPDDPGYPDQPDPNDPPSPPEGPDDPDPEYPNPDDPYDPEDPNDDPDEPNTPPDGPDDPSSVFGLVNVQIVQDSFYINEYDEDLGEPDKDGEYDLDKDGQSEEEEP